jgi:predicted glycogen debranching enzyme
MTMRAMVGVAPASHGAEVFVDELSAEWLETDGLGGFASGTVSGIRTRRYHALFLVARRPPAERFVLVNGLEAHIVVHGERFALSSQRYSPDVVHPDGASRLVAFEREPWPSFSFALGNGLSVKQELCARAGSPLVVVAWTLSEPVVDATLELRPLLSVRGFHELTRENGLFRFDPECGRGWVTFRPYAELPSVCFGFDGVYRHEPSWYRSFFYEEEARRGLDAVEDLASPGSFRLGFAGRRAALILADSERSLGHDHTALELADQVLGEERARRALFASPLERAADQYLVTRGSGKTVIAGYPWFGDWGRDTFISLFGLCFATGRIEDAREILCQWAEAVSEGMTPNRFVDSGDTAEYNACDASLWFVVAVGELLERAELSASERALLTGAVRAIVDGYRRGTRHGIVMDPADGLIRAGEPGVQLTWMDAKVGDWVVTPRRGKPVEVQALWVAALGVAEKLDPSLAPLRARARASFETRFWNESRAALLDVVDVDGVAGAVDASLRPNQIFAVGGLPEVLLGPERARRVVDTVEAKLLTPLGLRSLERGDAAYISRYQGDLRARDAAYHQGTVWPWLAGPFVEAWVRVRGSTPEAKRLARERFLAPLREHLGHAGLGHVSEIADGDPPHAPRGCPFQAWSLAELLRLDRVVLGEV